MPNLRPIDRAMNTDVKTRDRVAAVLLLSLFVASLFLPALKFAGGGDSPYALNDFVSGLGCLIAIPFVMFIPNWWANPLFLWGVTRLVRGNGRAPLWVGTVAVVLAATAPWVIAEELVRALAGRKFVFFPLRSGYFVWLSAMIGLAAYSWFADRTAIPPSPPSDR